MTTNTLHLAKGRVELTPYGAIVEGIGYAEWKEVLGSLNQIKHTYLAAVADVAAYGRANFGDEKVNAAFEQLEFDLNDATKATAIGTISLELRTEYELTAEHAFLLSRLADGQEREKWAKLTNENQLTPLELKRSIEADKIVRQKDILEQSGHGAGINTIQGAAFSVRKWEKQMGGRDKIMGLPSTDRTKLLQVLQPVIELAATIEQSLS